jgi:predicted nucleic acid-binding protein
LNVYADTSFLVSIYLPDIHSAKADQLIAGRPGITLTPLHHAELVHAVEQNVFRRRISELDAKDIYRNFDRDCRARLWIEAAFPEDAFLTGVTLARRYVSALGTRTLDSLHVACALELKTTRFWTFDDRQAKLARAAGLRTT